MLPSTLLLMIVAPPPWTSWTEPPIREPFRRATEFAPSACTLPITTTRTAFNVAPRSTLIVPFTRVRSSDRSCSAGPGDCRPSPHRSIRPDRSRETWRRVRCQPPGAAHYRGYPTATGCRDVLDPVMNEFRPGGITYRVFFVGAYASCAGPSRSPPRAARRARAPAGRQLVCRLGRAADFWIPGLCSGMWRGLVARLPFDPLYFMVPTADPRQHQFSRSPCSGRHDARAEQQTPR